MKVYGDMTRRLAATIVSAGLTFGLSGCVSLHKRPKVPVLPPVLAPVPLATVPPSTNPPMIAAPEVELPPMPIAAAAATPRRERRHLVPKAATPAETLPSEEATTPQPMTDEAAIGDLTAGGAANPQAQQEASDLIGSIEKRLSGLPAQTVRRQRAQVNRVHNFARQAREALNSGDVEGATTLATKAKLLLDDLEKLGTGE